MEASDTFGLKIGIIGGSGFYHMPELSNPQIRVVDTEFGPPSDHLVEGTIANVPVVVLARHGKGHRFNPSEVNYRANIRALHKCGVTNILSATSCGSLKEDLAPGDFVLLDSFIDRTTKRDQTFHYQSSPLGTTVCHIPMHPSFCAQTGQVLDEAARQLCMENFATNHGTVVTIEGPRFSSRAESNMFRMWNADVINMTTVPEVVLAKELGISYASVAMVTDYDCWKENAEPVNVPQVLATMAINVEKVRRLFVKTVQLMPERKWENLWQQNKDMAKNSIMH